MEEISYELFFGSMVPRLVIQCRENCGDRLFPADKEDYLAVKSRGRVSFMNNQGETDLKYCPLYIHFKVECLKGYLCYKSIFPHKLALEVYLMNFFIWRKNISFSRYLDFCVFVKSTNFKICDVIIGIAT